MQASRGYGRYAAIATTIAITKGTRFAKAHPLLCKAVPTAVGFAFGDFLTQYMNRDKEQPFKMQLDKTAKMAVVGATVAGPLGLLALQRLSLIMPVAAAVIGSEVLGCLIWQAAYCSICPAYRAGAVRLGNSLRQKFQPQGLVAAAH